MPPYTGIFPIVWGLFFPFVNVINCLKYGSDEPKTILLKRYGFSDEEIKIVYDNVKKIDENGIEFEDSIQKVTDEILKDKIKRYK